MTCHNRSICRTCKDIFLNCECVDICKKTDIILSFLTFPPNKCLCSKKASKDLRLFFSKNYYFELKKKETKPKKEEEVKKEVEQKKICCCCEEEEATECGGELCNRCNWGECDCIERKANKEFNEKIRNGLSVEEFEDMLDDFHEKAEHGYRWTGQMGWCCRYDSKDHPQNQKDAYKVRIKKKIMHLIRQKYTEDTGRKISLKGYMKCTVRQISKHAINKYGVEMGSVLRLVRCYTKFWCRADF